MADICKKAAFVVLDNGGVVRKIEHMGVRTLPYRMKSHMNFYTQGRYDLLVDSFISNRLPPAIT